MVKDLKIDYEVRRYANRASYREEDLIEILNSTFLSTVSFSQDGIAYTIPMNYINRGKEVYLHCSPESRMYRILNSRNVVTFTVLLIDGIVLNSRVANNSVNYRSAIIYGKSVEIKDENEKLEIFRELTERILPGRWNDSVHPSHEELSKVAVFRLDIINFSVKIRKGFGMNYSGDNIWEGVIPFKVTKGEPQTEKDVNLPDYIKLYLQ